MALDLRVIDLSERCHQVLSDLLHAAESTAQVDATREHYPPHFHVVVIPETEEPPVNDLVARYPRAEELTDGQDQ